MDLINIAKLIFPDIHNDLEEHENYKYSIGNPVHFYLYVRGDTQLISIQKIPILKQATVTINNTQFSFNENQLNDEFCKELYNKMKEVM